MTYTLLPRHFDAPEREFVYFMYSAGRIKIGYSRGADGRLKTLKTHGPFPPVLVLVMHGNIGTEQDLHLRFYQDRVHGEWFAFSRDLRSYLRQRLCDAGLSTLERAEAEYRDACEQFLAGYKPPLNRKPRPTCVHGMPLNSLCPPCERERDLSILSQIKEGTYVA